MAGDVDAPHLLDVEVFSVLRGLALGGKLDAAVAEEARRDHLALTITRHELAPFAERVWELLRYQFTSHDACYLRCHSPHDPTEALLSQRGCEVSHPAL